MINIKVIEELVKEYGENKTLGEILKEAKENECYKCKGTGEIKEYNKEYDFACQNGAWSLPPKYIYIKCDVCNGKGYINKKEG